LAQQVGDVGHAVGIHFPLGEVFLMQGDLEHSRRHLEQAVALYNPSRDRDLVHQQGQDPAVASLLFLSWALWLQGYPDQAAQKVEAALRLAEELNHPYTKGQAAVLASTFYQLVRQWPKCQAQAETALALAEQGHFRFLLAGGTMCHGSVLAQQGRIEDGIDILRQGLDAWEATGTQLALPYSHARLAEAYLLAGKQESGLQALDEPFSCVEEVWWLPEQHRLRAELLLLAPGNEAQAEDVLWKAIGVAREQQSKSLALRAATSLARLLHKQGRDAEGRGPLMECYAWFTEGFDTADLEEARRLLDVLGRDTEQSSAARNGQTREALPIPPSPASCGPAPLARGIGQPASVEAGLA
jgi:adenylate cyclase